MILSQPDLKLAWKKKLIRFSPDITEDQIGLSSIDLRLGYIVTHLKKSNSVIKPAAKGFDPTLLVQNVDLRGKNPRGKPIPFRLSPGRLMLAFTLERIEVPDSLAANVQGKSSLARAGAAVHITAPHIHPGFRGNITLEMYNHGPWRLEFVPAQDLVCQVIFYQITRKVAKEMIEKHGTFVDQRTPFPPRKVPVAHRKKF